MTNMHYVVAHKCVTLKSKCVGRKSCVPVFGETLLADAANRRRQWQSRDNVYGVDFGSPQQRPPASVARLVVNSRANVMP